MVPWWQRDWQCAREYGERTSAFVGGRLGALVPADGLPGLLIASTTFQARKDNNPEWRPHIVRKAYCGRQQAIHRQRMIPE